MQGKISFLPWVIRGMHPLFEKHSSASRRPGMDSWKLNYSCLRVCVSYFVCAAAVSCIRVVLELYVVRISRVRLLTVVQPHGEETWPLFFFVLHCTIMDTTGYPVVAVLSAPSTVRWYFVLE